MASTEGTAFAGCGEVSGPTLRNVLPVILLISTIVIALLAYAIPVWLVPAYGSPIGFWVMALTFLAIRHARARG